MSRNAISANPEHYIFKIHSHYGHANGNGGGGGGGGGGWAMAILCGRSWIFALSLKSTFKW